jgi:hypothetical protein
LPATRSVKIEFHFSLRGENTTGMDQFHGAAFSRWRFRSCRHYFVAAGKLKTTPFGLLVKQTSPWNVNLSLGEKSDGKNLCFYTHHSIHPARMTN